MSSPAAPSASPVRASPSPGPALVARGLRKAFGKTQAVDGVSFELRRGETYGLLGPNGAGKTTILHILVGALRPDAGTVEIDGIPDPARPEARRRIGVAPQSAALYGDLTAGENLAFFGRLYGLDRATLAERVRSALDLAGLADRAGSRVSTYSGGMKQRLNVACALLHDPQVLLLDEPTAGVDPQSRNHLIESVGRLRDAGRTVLYTTHAMEEAQRLCDRVAILDHGRILSEGTVSELIARHGGVSVIQAEFERPPSAGEALGGTIDGCRVRLESSRPFDDAARLASSATRLVSLDVRQPSLETVFLTLTGRSLRDA